MDMLSSGRTWAGRERPFALFWRRLITALDEVDFPSLRRRVPVRSG